MVQERRFSLYKKFIEHIPGGFRPPPMRITFKVTSTCNLHCAMCDGLPYADLPTAAFKDIIDRIASAYSCWPFRPSVGVQGGEPFARDDIFDILEHIVSRGLPCDIITNGTLLNNEKLRRLLSSGVREIAFSIDGLRPFHDSLRGEGNFDKTFNNFKTLCELDRGNKIRKVINAVVTQQSLRTTEDFCLLFADYPARINLMPILIYDLQGKIAESAIKDEGFFYDMLGRLLINKAIGNRKIYSRQLDPVYERMSRDNNSLGCSMVNWRMNVYSDGTAKVCRRMQAMNLLEKDLMTIMNHQCFRERRLSVKRQKGALDFCRGCDHLYGCALMPLQDVVNEYINFCKDYKIYAD